MTPVDLCLTIIAAAGSLMPLSDERVALVCDLADVVVEATIEHDLDPLLLVSLVYVESRWNPKARSWAGACGLTQVVPRWYPETCSQLRDPEISLRAGARILRDWINHGGSIRRGLACYNAGYPCLSISSARDYADQILRIRSDLESLYLRLFSCYDEPLSVHGG